MSTAVTLVYSGNECKKQGGLRHHTHVFISENIKIDLLRISGKQTASLIFTLK